MAITASVVNLLGARVSKKIIARLLTEATVWGLPTERDALFLRTGREWTVAKERTALLMATSVMRRPVILVQNQAASRYGDGYQ
jgi:hypothetical protein